MKNILWDVIRAQYVANEFSEADSLVDKDAELKALSRKIFNIHKISKENFEKSYTWYTEHPVMLNAIFDSLYEQKQRLHMTEPRRDQLERSFPKKIPIDE